MTRSTLRPILINRFFTGWKVQNGISDHLSFRVFRSTKRAPFDCPKSTRIWDISTEADLCVTRALVVVGRATAVFTYSCTGLAGRKRAWTRVSISKGDVAIYVMMRRVSIGRSIHSTALKACAQLEPPVTRRILRGCMYCPGTRRHFHLLVNNHQRTRPTTSRIIHYSSPLLLLPLAPAFLNIFLQQVEEGIRSATLERINSWPCGTPFDPLSNENSSTSKPYRRNSVTASVIASFPSW